MGHILLTVALLADVGGAFASAPKPAATAKYSDGSADPAYAAFRRLVEGGASGVLYVGRPVPTGFSEYRATCSVDSLDGTDPGVYQCDLKAGRAVMVRRADATFATPVRSAAQQLLSPLTGCAGGRCPTPTRSTRR